MTAIAGKRVLLTGASGGLGQPLARELSQRGAQLILPGRNQTLLEQLVSELRPGSAEILPGELSDPQFCQQLGSQLVGAEGVDLLINLAGTNTYRNFEAENPAELATMIQVNLVTPVLLTRALLPDMLARGCGHIVNIGSILGSLGLPFFATYSATKGGLRLFSEALRRELADSPIKVSYVAPRAARTNINSDALYEMADATKMAVDDPESVARQIIIAVERDQSERFLGWPEKLFVLINGLLPGLIDKVIASQTRKTRKFAVAEQEK